MDFEVDSGVVMVVDMKSVGGEFDKGWFGAKGELEGRACGHMRASGDEGMIRVSLVAWST